MFLPFRLFPMNPSTILTTKPTTFGILHSKVKYAPHMCYIHNFVRYRKRTRTTAPSTYASAHAQSSIFPNTSQVEIQALWKMARPINFLPSLLLVLVGAWSAENSWTVIFRHPSVLVVAFTSSTIAAASCVINDYFDAETDSINAPDKPVPSGTVPSEHALFIASLSYIIVLLAACCFSNQYVRLIIAASAAITLIYTPILKRISLVKNIAVAFVIGLTPLVGALAVGVNHITASTLVPTVYLFLSVWYREILMDINDCVGDEAENIKTLPVVLGKQAALGIGVLLLGVCMVLVLITAFYGNGILRLSAYFFIPMPAVRVLAALAALIITTPHLITAASLAHHNFPKEEVGAAIDATLKMVGMGMVLLIALV